MVLGGLRYCCGTRLYFRDRNERIWPAESFALGPPRRLAPAVCVARALKSGPAWRAPFRAFPPGRVARFLSDHEAGRTGHDFQVHVTRRARIGVIGAYKMQCRDHLECAPCLIIPNPPAASRAREFTAFLDALMPLRVP